VKALVGHIAAWRRSYNVPVSWFLRGMLWSCGVRTLGVAALEQLCPKPLNAIRVRRSMRFAPSYLAPDSALQAELERRLRRSFETKSTSGPLHVRDMIAALNHPIVAQAREEHYERGRRSGVWLRHPFFDADLAAKVYRMPNALLHHDGRAKYPLRRRAVSRFPTLGFDRQKKLAGSPFFRSVLSKELPLLWPKTSLSALGQLGVVDVRGAQAMAKNAFQDQNTRSLLPLWELLRLEAWAESRL
jgi:hypothetical protein